MKLSKSELSIIFANYIGQYVLFQRDKTLRVNIFDNKFARNYTKGPRILDQWLLYALSENDFDDVKLMLRPIQTIKDEEIEVMIRVCDNFGYSYVAKVDRESDEEQINIYCYDDNRKYNPNDDDYRKIVINFENESRDYICCECGSDGSISVKTITDIGNAHFSVEGTYINDEKAKKSFDKFKMKDAIEFREAALQMVS